MRHIRKYISEAFSLQEAKNYLFECLDRTDDYNFEVTLESCPKLADYYCLSELNISREFRNHPEYIYLALIVVNEEDQYSGYGTGFMEDLCEWADTRGKIITLTPDDDFGASSVGRLIKFYKRFGFVENKGKNTDFTHKQFMHRKPNVTEAVARRTTGKYSHNITVDSTQDDFERFIKSTPLNIQEIVHTDTFIQKIDEMTFGTGICYVNRNMGRNSTEYIICPEGEPYRYDLLYTDGKLYQALRTERYGNRVWTHFSKDKETVLKEITEYYG